MQGESVLKAREQADFDDEDDGFLSFKLTHPVLYELLKSTQEKVAEIEREGNSALEVGEMELQARAELDARVRNEQSTAIRLAKEEQEQLRRAEALRILENDKY